MQSNQLDINNKHERACVCVLCPFCCRVSPEQSNTYIVGNTFTSSSAVLHIAPASLNHAQIYLLMHTIEHEQRYLSFSCHFHLQIPFLSGVYIVACWQQSISFDTCACLPTLSCACVCVCVLYACILILRKLRVRSAKDAIKAALSNCFGLKQCARERVHVLPVII